MNLKALQEHLNKWLLAYVVLAMALGLLIGYPEAGWTKAHPSLVSNLTTAMVFLIVYPMMINLRLEALVNAGRNFKGLTLAVLYNFLWAPVVGWLLAQTFLRDPMLA